MTNFKDVVSIVSIVFGAALIFASLSMFAKG